MKRGLTAGALLILATLIGHSSIAAAQTRFELAPPENNYPLNITFRTDITADEVITDVALRFSLKNRGVSGLGKPDSFTPGESVSVTVVVDTDPDTNWLPIGNEFVYFWEATLASGEVVQSAEQSYLYLPPGRDWKEASNGLLTVYYYGQRTRTANRFLEAAREVYEEVGQGLLHTEPEHLPVKVILVVSPEEVEESQPSKGTTVEAAGIVTCGYRPGSADDIIVVAARCGGGSSLDTLRHELGHILNAAAGESPLVSLPAWLDEGLAVLAQEENDFEGAFESALRHETLLPFNRLYLPPSNPDDTLLFYGQAHAMVRFLIVTYGQDKLTDLLGLTSEGTRFDVAFEQVYGMDMAGFESEFRRAYGLPPADQAMTPPAEATPSRGQPAERSPTAVTPGAGQVGSAGGTDRVLVASIAGAALLLLVGLFLFLLSQLLHNRRLARPAAGPPGEGEGEQRGGRSRRGGWGQPD